MPPKKPIKRNNKKKKGNGGSSSAENGIGVKSLKTTTAPDKGKDDDEPVVGGLYSVYKCATQRFKDGLAALVPAAIFFHDRVQTMMDAVDYVVENAIAIPSILLEDCRISLCFRKKYSRKMDKHGDDGHEYFILVLNYCFQCLKPLVPKTTRTAGKEQARQFNFTDLELSDSEDDEEGDVPATTLKMERPKAPTHDFTFDELLKGSDRLQACAFMDSMDGAMGEIARAYKTLKSNMRKLNIQEASQALVLMEDIMEASVVTNSCIRQVQYMEEQLKLDHPHLCSSYRIMGCVCLVQYIDMFNSAVQKWGKSVPRTDMTAFIGDVVESGFRNPQESDPQNCISRLVRTFCHKWSLPRDQIKEMVEGTIHIIHIEIMTNDVVHSPMLTEALQTIGIDPHSWLDMAQFIGGDRNILNTQKLLQGLSDTLADFPKAKLIVKPGYWGERWNERRCPAKKIRGDMDQALMGDILPELLASCQRGALASDVPRMDELLPLFKLLRQFVSNPSKPVSLSLTFSVHAILTSVIEMQGNKDVALVAAATKATYNKYFRQLPDNLNSDLPNSKTWRPNLKHIMSAKLLPTVVDLPVSDQSEKLGFWNPFCGGLLNTFLCYQVNFERGSTLIDSYAQLRLVLHLNNAFKVRNLIAGDIPLVTTLDHFFAGVPSVWQGDKPKRDNLVKSFWLAYGAPVDVVNRLTDDCRKLVLDPQSAPKNASMRAKDGDAIREMEGCRPEHFSQSYQRICLGDFSGLVDRFDKDHTASEIEVGLWQATFVARVNDALSMMTLEEELLSWNLASIAGCLNRFVYDLVDKLGWTQLSRSTVAATTDTNKHRLALVSEFVNKILAPLEFLDSVEHDPVLLASRNYFMEYFNGLKTSDYEYFPTRASLAKQPKAAPAVPVFGDGQRVVIDGYEVFVG